VDGESASGRSGKGGQAASRPGERRTEASDEVIPAPVGLVALMVALVLGPLQPALRVVVAEQVQAPPPTMYVAENARCGVWWPLAAEVGWPEPELPTLDRVMWCESKCQPDAYNRSGASGLMQVMPMWHHGRDPFDATVNLTMALEVWHRQGWRAWSCF
jgi:hypothetical protein